MAWNYRRWCVPVLCYHLYPVKWVFSSIEGRSTPYQVMPHLQEQVLAALLSLVDFGFDTVRTVDRVRRSRRNGLVHAAKVGVVVSVGWSECSEVVRAPALAAPLAIDL